MVGMEKHTGKRRQFLEHQKIPFNLRRHLVVERHFTFLDEMKQ